MKAVLPGIPIVESPLFYSLVDELGWNDEEKRVGTSLHERGYAVIDFSDDQLDRRIERIKKSLTPRFGSQFDDPGAVKSTGENQRLQDAWIFDDDVRAIATNHLLMDLLTKLYGRRPVPFQTLNFPVGTQQSFHSDCAHFSCLPERFMCGVWLAMEDIHQDAGPLTYIAGSHRWPVISNLMVGRTSANNAHDSAQSPFEDAWKAIARATNAQPETFCPNKGQALIWAANLLHGGSPQIDPTRTRWSQVSHYYFEDCIYYTPAFSDEAIGELDVRSIENIATGELEPSRYLGRQLSTIRKDQEQQQRKTRRRSLLARLRRRAEAANSDLLPDDFDADAYLHLNPDVERSGANPAEHFLAHGRHERRRYRRN
jgi:hypothetical protein